MIPSFVEIQGKLLSDHRNLVEALKPGCRPSGFPEDHVFPSSPSFGDLMFLPSRAFSLCLPSVSAFLMPNMEYLSRSLSRVILESSSDFLNYRNSSGSRYLKKNSPGSRYCEDAGLSAVSRIYVKATLKLFVLFDSESREPLLGTVKYALAHFS